MYGIQVDEFDNAKSAEDRTNSLNQLGHNAFYQCTQSEDGKTHCRVFIDQFETRVEAEEEAEFLKKLELISNYTIRALDEASADASSVTPPAIKPSAGPPEKPLEGQPSKEPMPVPSPPIQMPQPEPVMNPGPVESYSIQVGSYREKVNAEDMIARLKQSGDAALMHYETVTGKGDFYRVYLKWYGSRSAAEKKAKSLQQAQIISDYIIQGSYETPASPPIRPTAHDKIYFLHVNSYQDDKNAEKNVQTINKQGYSAFFIAEEASEKTWFRVYVGRFNNEETASQAGEELKGKGLISYFQIVSIDQTL
jgi:cell division septation protein DedD